MYLNQMDSIQKRIKIPIFYKKKKCSSYHGYFDINKNKIVFFLLKAYISLMMFVCIYFVKSRAFLSVDLKINTFQS